MYSNLYGKISMTASLQKESSPDLFSYSSPFLPPEEGLVQSTWVGTKRPGEEIETADPVRSKKRKMDNAGVFDRMREVICSITSPNSKSSGFFLGRNVAVVSFHPIVGDVCRPERERVQFSSEQLRLQYNQKEYPVGFELPFPSACSMNQRQVFIDRYFGKAGKMDLMFLKTPQPVCNQFFPIIPEDFILKEGMKVYLGGFPFAQTVPTFHKGMISSVKRDAEDDMQYFTIDGTIVAGNSGSPVFVQIEGELFIAGIIIAEVADLDPDFRKVTSWLEHFGKQENLDGFHVTVTDPDGTRTSISRDQFVIKAINTLRRNMSTGIGKAVDARMILRLQNPYVSEEEVSLDLQNSFFVAKQRAQEMVKTYQKGEDRYFLKPDDHGGKHIKGAFHPKTKRDFLAMTETGPATFYPDYARKYNEILETVIKMWVDQGANPDEPFVTFAEPVGADQGCETSTIELYYGGEIGSHIRPKHRI